METSLTTKDLEGFKEAYQKQEKYALAERAVTRNGVNAAGVDDRIVRSAKPTFSIDLDAGDITNQKHSGRCWMFAGLNVLRKIALTKLNVKNLELSQPYLQFFDKLEKANCFLDRIIEQADQPTNSRENMYVFQTTIGDGGYWSNFVSLVTKYGVVPLDAMPETAVSNNTDELNVALTALLNQDAYLLRSRYQKGTPKDKLAGLKKAMLSEIYRVLAIALGVPPVTFDLEVTQKGDDKKYVQETGITPQAFFAKYIAEDLKDYVPLSDAPIPGFDLYHAYYSKLVPCVENGQKEIIFNVPTATLKKAVVASLKAKEPVWFAADVLSSSLRKEGILAKDVVNVNALFDTTNKLDKGNRLAYLTSFCNHAMTFTGVNLVNGKPNRFKVENSWGKDNGTDGFFVMDEGWFDSFVYQAIIKKEYLPKDLVKKYENALKNPTAVEPFFAIFTQVQ